MSERSQNKGFSPHQRDRTQKRSTGGQVPEFQHFTHRELFFSLGSDANLFSIPAPVWTPGRDGGPYLSAASVITKDPDTGIQAFRTWVSIECRSMMLRARVFLLPKTGEILLAGSGLFKAYGDDTAETMAEIETLDSRLAIWA